MTTLRFFAGLLAIIAVVVPAGAVGWTVQARLPARDPALRALAAVVAAVTVPLLAGQLLGAVGLFRIGPLIVGTALVAAGAVAALRRWAPPPTEGAPAGPTVTLAELRQAYPRWLLLGIVVVVGAITVRWISSALGTFAFGISDPDSVQYHLPFAAEFAKTGWTTRFHPLFPDPTQLFYTANSELLQSMGLLAMGRDVVAPIANVLWFAVLLLAGWCAGIRDRAAPLTLLLAAFVGGLPIITYTNSGTALSDISMLACLTAGIALWRNADGDPRWTFLGALGLGLAVGMKLTALPTAGMLGIAIVLLAGPKQRARMLGLVLAAASLGCAFWFLRNLIRTGSPLPSVHLPLLPRTELPLVDEMGRSVSQYLFDGDVWESTLWPGLRFFFGWAGLVAVAAVGLLGAGLLRARQDRTLMALVAVGAVGAVSYLFVPATAWGEEGEPILLLFSVNLRYLLPAAIVLATAGTIAIAHHWERGALALGAVLVVAVGVEGFVYRDIWYPRDSHTLQAVLAVAALLGLAVAIHRYGRQVVSSPRFLPVASVVAVALLAVGGLVGASRARLQISNRDRSGDRPMWQVIQNIPPGSRIGYFGLGDNYGLYGPERENDVMYIGVSGPRGAFRVVESCREYLEVITAMDLDYAVLGDDTLYPLRHLDLPGWTDPQPGVRKLVVDGEYTVYEMSGPYDPARCEGLD